MRKSLTKLSIHRETLLQLAAGSPLLAETGTVTHIVRGCCSCAAGSPDR
jgi:hypothetical protein